MLQPPDRLIRRCRQLAAIPTERKFMLRERILKDALSSAGSGGLDCRSVGEVPAHARIALRRAHAAPPARLAVPLRCRTAIRKAS